MSKRSSIFLFCFVAVAMILAVFVAPFGAVAQDDKAGAPEPRANRDISGLEALSELSEAPPVDKLHPALRARAQAGGTEEVSIYVAIQGQADMGKYLDMAITHRLCLAG